MGTPCSGVCLQGQCQWGRAQFSCMLTVPELGRSPVAWARLGPGHAVAVEVPSGCRWQRAHSQTRLGSCLAALDT